MSFFVEPVFGQIAIVFGLDINETASNREEVSMSKNSTCTVLKRCQRSSTTSAFVGSARGYDGLSSPRRHQSTLAKWTSLSTYTPCFIGTEGGYAASEFFRARRGKP